VRSRAFSGNEPPPVCEHGFARHRDRDGWHSIAGGRGHIRSVCKIECKRVNRVLAEYGDASSLGGYSMNGIKAVVRVLYVSLRFVFLPVIFVFRPTGVSRQGIVTSATMGIVVFVIQPIATAKLGPDHAVGFTAVGALGIFVSRLG
jgi:hypothetical protein